MGQISALHRTRIAVVSDRQDIDRVSPSNTRNIYKYFTFLHIIIVQVNLLISVRFLGFFLKSPSKSSLEGFTCFESSIPVFNKFCLVKWK